MRALRIFRIPNTKKHGRKPGEKIEQQQHTKDEEEKEEFSYKRKNLSILSDFSHFTTNRFS